MTTKDEERRPQCHCFGTPDPQVLLASRAALTLLTIEASSALNKVLFKYGLSTPGADFLALAFKGGEREARRAMAGWTPCKAATAYVYGAVVAIMAVDAAETLAAFAGLETASKEFDREALAALDDIHKHARASLVVGSAAIREGNKKP